MTNLLLVLLGIGLPILLTAPILLMVLAASYDDSPEPRLSVSGATQVSEAALDTSAGD